MPRTREIDDTQILNIARKCFLDKGLSTTTKTISRAAGISEGVIFQRFRTKERLIEAAFSSPEIDADAVIRRAAGDHGDSRRRFEDVLVAVFAVLRREAVRELPWLSTRGTARRALGAESVAGQLATALSRHLAAEHAAGRLTVAAPDRVAAFLVGALHHMALAEVASGPSPLVSERAVRDAAAALVAGVDAQPRRDR